MTGKGEALSVALQSGSEPNPVDIVLTLGATRYCVSFARTTRFSPESLV